VGLLLTESPYDDDRQCNVAALADVVWTNERTSIGALRQVQPRTLYLPHAWQHGIHRPRALFDARYVPRHDVVFVGTGFPERREWLTAVNWHGIDLALYGSWREVIDRADPLWRYVKRGGTPIPNGFAAELYRSAKIGLNFFRQSMGWGDDAKRCTTAESLNPRSYELAACGAFQICDARPEVTEVFRDLVPTFDWRQPKTLGPLVRRWLKDDAGRAAVAAQLPGSVAAHSWDARAAQMLIDMAATPGRAR
jgi:spore maturation protein CgeB